MRFLVTGCRGLLGSFVLAELGSEGTGYDLPDLDITSFDSVNAVTDEIAPDCIVNCASMTDVDLCERNPSGARMLNSTGVLNLVATGIRLLTVSTDQVFDGKGPDPILENTQTNPANEYAKSKREGEVAALSSDGNAVIRTSWLFGRDKGMVPRFWEALIRGETVRAVTDQTSSITCVADLAKEIVSIARSGESGIFHRVNRSALTPFDVASGLRKLADRGKVIPVRWEEIGVDARRPVFSVLGTRRGQLLPSAWNAVERWIEEHG
jgi:dTDP-4-dehydrorhamnose reductase